ncbi:PREDICTED: kinase D-interacting substrate of 220 kDa isoform X3 [Nicrophorus vespilloides]|uniref:Kinase D-interacting substrate of 220 kDa isoform X3 n=1 Tax=Nicrophorus vespilloides TaxID=110193 RepID=A0ABM1M160_NICVS|nr:PREDICTED: kinase D-interacting substrate of 220 kDa isoform X3 [Nicrophorus vespilloides]
MENGSNSEPDGSNHKKTTRHSISTATATPTGRRRSSFLHLHIPEAGAWRGSLTHLHLPTFTLTSPEGQQSPWFNFTGLGIRRHSHNTLHRTDSMVSLCFRSLSTFINENNLQGLQQFLESKDTIVDDRDENGGTALILAASKGKSSFVRELLAHGADPNAEDSDNWSALLCASKEGYVDICLQLIEQHAEIEHRDMGGWTPLMWATYKGRTEVVKVLLEYKADVNAHGNYHISSLLWAAGRGHTEIVDELLKHGAKVNWGDKYGTTALIWASRKGHTDIVKSLLLAGANADTAGMYSWTSLLVATQGNHEDIVNLLLEYRPNVNALDKDGCSALTIACKEGFYEIATSLMNAGAYINIQDRTGDTNLIHAVKGGHRSVVEALLKKYADVDVSGKDRKTASYMAVEKGYVAIVKMLLSSNPDLEIPTKDGDTPLLKAVRSRNADIVQLLLDKKAKVGAADKKGDTALHIAMRARSKAIVEILLRNPKHSHLLYRPNRAGETPYNIDLNHQKTILGQIFGARRLNTNEDNENMLGYDLYSSALADVLSEPSLSMPITVGLYAKWGSGKSFILNKVRDEMKNFARQWIDPVFQFTPLLFIILMHISMLIGTIVGLSAYNWILGLSVGLAVLVVSYIFLALVWFASKRYDWDWPYNFNTKLTMKMNNLKLILQIMFCHPPGAPTHDTLSAQPIRFYFTDQIRVSSTTGGENSVVQMIGSLYDAIESDYGAVVTRLYRAFKPKPVKSSSSWKWRKVCCLPYVLVFEIIFIFFLIGVCALTVYILQVNTLEANEVVEKMTLQVILIIAAFFLGTAAIANLYTWSKMFGSLIFSQRRHLQRTIAKLDTLKSEGFLQALRSEVNLMKDMVKCLDSLSAQQTRLVIIVDGLDSSEQDKVLLVLDAVHMLFSDANCPFIAILAIDPHVISKIAWDKAVEMNSRRLFSESNIGGHGYLNNMVHLPFYLQNTGLRKVKVAQQTASIPRKSNAAATTSNDDALSVTGKSLSARRLSSENTLLSSTEKLSKFSMRKGSKKLKLSESVASSIGSNLNRIGGAQDLTKMLLTDDYFSDVNPKSMRRLMNVVYITGRLLKAFHIDFNWYRLASWINITEQWPFRTSWIIYHFDTCEDKLEDNVSLKAIYDKIRPHIPTLKDVEPLLELDRDERKFDIFLTFHRSSLLVSDLKIFLPFTINLDPYLKKVIKEETQGLDEDLIMGTPHRPMSMTPMHSPWPQSASDWSAQKHPLSRRMRNLNRTHGPTAVVYPQAGVMGWAQPWGDHLGMATPQPQYPLAPVTSISPEVLECKLSSLNVDGICKLLQKMDEFSPDALTEYTDILKQNNVNGRVLLHCDLEELKRLLNMSFGDWEMFKVMIVSLREHELTTVIQQDESKNVRFTIGKKQVVPSTSESRKGSLTGKPVTSGSESELKIQNDTSSRNKQSVMEKQYQVTLEEQMICGALQTLNEEACEDVMEETEDVMESDGADIPRTFVIHPSPESSQEAAPFDYRSRTNSSCGIGETDFVLLQSSPIGALNWQPVSISIQGNSENISEQSSRCSSPHLTPVMERKTNSFKLSNFKPSLDLDGSKRGKHVIIKSDGVDGNSISVSTKNATVLYEKQENKVRPTSLILKSEKATARNRSRSIDNSNNKQKQKKGFDQLQKLLYSSPDLNDASDNESTPLVSDNSTPSKTFSPGYMTSHSSNSLANSFQSFSPDEKTNLKKGEQTISETSPIAYNLASKQASEGSEHSISLDSSRLMSASNLSLSSRNSISSGQLSRQDALDGNEENLTDVYCDPKCRK